MTGVDRAPARRTRRIALAAGVLSLAAIVPFSWFALGAAVPGLGLLVLGLARGRHRPVTLGALGLFLGAIAAGVGGAPVEAVLVAVCSAVVAWDLGGNAITLGLQLGRAADTTRLEAVRVGASLGVGVLSAGLGYGLYLSATGGQPVAAVVFLLLAAVLLLEAIP